MGVIWKTTMPLMSTLAALVIIVHSADEDLEEYRGDLRPRAMDAGTTNYELPWGAVKMEPIITQSSQTDTWDGSPEDPPKRRRPLRKRKRRPQTPTAEDLILLERHLEQREYRPYHEENYGPLTEIPQRRRKKVDNEPNEWNDEPAQQEKPLRRKGQRRKRPAAEPWHELSEFSEFTEDENPTEINVSNQKKEITNDESDDGNNDSRDARLTLKLFYNEERKRNPDTARDVIEEGNEDDPAQFQVYKDNKEYEENNTPQIKEDKSLSEFSLENSNPERTGSANEEEIPLKESVNDIKEQKKRPLDPMSLKEILKKSNGKSLSELLQQHNLTLADLLNGEKKVLSVLKPTDSPQNVKEVTVHEPTNQILVIKTPETFTSAKPEVSEIREVDKSNEKYNFHGLTSSEKPTFTTVEYVSPKTAVTTVTSSGASLSTIERYKLNKDLSTSTNQTNILNLNEKQRTALRRRFPIGVRMKLRMIPLSNNSYKGQLSRDMIALTTKKYQNNRNFTKFREWKEITPVMINKTKTESSEEERDNVRTTTTPGTITATYTTQTDSESETETVNTDTESTSTMTSIEITTEVKTTTTTEKPIISSVPRPRGNMTSLRQQAFVNRLKKKRLKQKITSNEPTQEHLLKDIFNMANLVSASEFIAKVHPRATTLRDESETVTMLEDFITTEITTKATTQRSMKRSGTRDKTKSSTTMKPAIRISTTEENAKIEIEEILNDTLTSASLSQILTERNMTLNELVEHRERGSSHVHLADIFHNASKEPNPPEPFLSKSFIEPISKETYPLRALLEANLHDPTIKGTTIEPFLLPPQYINIPIVMDFGNNVNENGENSGIISLFNNFTKNYGKFETKGTKNYSNIVQNTMEKRIDKNSTYRISRQSHKMGNEHDLVTLNEIFSLMQITSNTTDDQQVSSNDSTSPIKSVKNNILEEDVDGDGLIALEDLQRIKELHHELSNDDIEFKSLGSQEATPTPAVIPETIHNNTRSVTVVTASIVGLIAVLFLLTYAAFKWKHQQQVFRTKHSTIEERIPTPVYENRKSNKNSSMRSMSPMLSSTIYSVNTLEKTNSSECPEYMWDTLRKPFQ